MKRDPRAVRFIDWWERNEEHYPDAYWFELFDSWTEPLSLDMEAANVLFDEASAEYHEREWRATQGMVITDLENIPDGMERAA